MAEEKQKAWWPQKRWWIAAAAATVLAALVLLDLVAAFTLRPDLRGSILGLLTPLAALTIGAAALLNFQETRRQNLASMKATGESLELTRRGQVTDRFSKAVEQLGN
jgi:hypothetical protein